jgi:hypothetical protein
MWGDAPSREDRAARQALAALLEAAMREPRTREEREADARRTAMLAKARAANVEEELRRLLCPPGSMFGSGN